MPSTEDALKQVLLQTLDTGGSDPLGAGFAAIERARIGGAQIPGLEGATNPDLVAAHRYLEGADMSKTYGADPYDPSFGGKAKRAVAAIPVAAMSGAYEASKLPGLDSLRNLVIKKLLGGEQGRWADFISDETTTPPSLRNVVATVAGAAGGLPGLGGLKK